MGGPNFCLDHDKQKEFMRTHIYLDFYVVGEGEKPSADIIKRFLDCQQSIRKLKEDDIPSCIYIKPDGSLHYGKAQRIMKNLDDIPSPWLSGYLDKFFDGKLAPIIETVRGCPFMCSYCVQGTELYNKIRKFPVERVKKEIEYIGEAIRDKSPEIGFYASLIQTLGCLRKMLMFQKPSMKCRRNSDGHHLLMLQQVKTKRIRFCRLWRIWMAR